MKQKQLKSKPISQLQIKKHRRIKSQQPVQSPMNFHQNLITHKFNPHHNTHFRSTHLIEVFRENRESIKVLISPHTEMSVAKEIVCKSLGVDKNSVYFHSQGHDYNFDYRFEQQIGLLEGDKKLRFEYISGEKDSNNRIIEDNKLNSYTIYDCLSVGGFSKVFLIRSKKSGKFYAAKFIDKHPNEESSVKFQQLISNEKFINQLLDHPMLVKMHQFIQTKDFYIFIMDYCPSGQLFCLMKLHRDMTEAQARFYFIETILGIDYMHSKSIIYRDIKPENILLDKDGHVKIADFGLAKIMREKSTSYCGSLEYMAPQIVLGNEHSFGVDHYCLGSLLFEMMVGCPPFYNPNFSPSQTKYHIVNSEVKFPSRRYLSEQFIDFVTKLLDKNPKTRLGSIGGIREILAHPWIGRFDRKAFEEHRIEPPFKLSLDKNNFETTYLPKEAIEQLKVKIYQEIEEKNRQYGILKTEQKKSFRKTVQFDDKSLKKISEPCESFHQKSRNRLRSTEASAKVSGTLTPSKIQDQYNPYAMYLRKNKSVLTCKKQHSISLSKNKSPSRSLHNGSSQKVINPPSTKNRSLTKNNTHNESNSNIIKNIFNSTYNKTKQWRRKSVEQVQDFKYVHNKRLNRKSGIVEKQNEMKDKFERKSKGLKKMLGNYQRNSCIEEKQHQERRFKKMVNRLSQAMVNLFPN